MKSVVGCRLLVVGQNQEPATSNEQPKTAPGFWFLGGHRGLSGVGDSDTGPSLPDNWQLTTNNQSRFPVLASNEQRATSNQKRFLVLASNEQPKTVPGSRFLVLTGNWQLTTGNQKWFPVLTGNWQLTTGN
jgi:hypothetical protein